jgi:hypothetical protein
LIRKIILLAVLLGTLLYFGTVAIPALIAESGALLYQGTTYNVPQGDYVAIHFSVQYESRISGGFSSDWPISLFIINGSQFLNFVDGRSMYTYEINYTTHSSFATILPKGSYYLVFNSNYDIAAPVTIRITVTNQIELVPLKT